MKSKKFSDFGIKPTLTHFVGDKMKISKILNREIQILDFSLQPSNYNGTRMTLQFELNGEKHILFTGSTVLMEMIEKVPKTEFPFLTTIVQEGEHYEFT